MIVNAEMLDAGICASKGWLKTAPRTAGALAAKREARALLALTLSIGGDSRIRLNPLTGRNRYGTKTEPVPDEISFASTTANSISESGFAAASQALGRLLSPDQEAKLSLRQWFDEIRARIVTLLGVPGSEAILAPSGTDAELLTLGLAASLARRPLTNVIIAPAETGSGIPLAAAGCHFSGSTARGATVARGGSIEGFAANEIEVAAIAIRDPGGAPREPAAIDRDAANVIERELHRGRDVLLHVLDTSKTGLAGVTREAARFLMASAPGHVRVAVDACQLRCSFAQLKRDLTDGFIVMATGSKFAGGPPFCGAVLLPAALAGEVMAEASLPKGLADYSAALDWPVQLRSRLGETLRSQANTGLGLRWVAALAGIAALADVSPGLQPRIAARFAMEVRARAQGPGRVALRCEEAHSQCASPSIVPLTLLNADGSFASLSEAQRFQAALLDPDLVPVCHAGQAVDLGTRTVLRIAASARACGRARRCEEPRLALCYGQFASLLHGLGAWRRYPGWHACRDGCGGIEHELRRP